MSSTRSNAPDKFRFRILHSTDKPMEWRYACNPEAWFDIECSLKRALQILSTAGHEIIFRIKETR